MKVSDIVVRDPDILGGTPCFRGTRVPLAVLFDNLADGLTVDQILEYWPTLNREDVLFIALGSERTPSISGSELP